VLKVVTNENDTSTCRQHGSYSKINFFTAKPLLARS
jgi:hypothetical protein